MAGWHHRLSRYEFEQTLGDVKDREAWHVPVHEVTKTQQLNNHKRFMTNESSFLLDLYYNKVFFFFPLHLMHFVLYSILFVINILISTLFLRICLPCYFLFLVFASFLRYAFCILYRQVLFYDLTGGIHLLFNFQITNIPGSEKL